MGDYLYFDGRERFTEYQSEGDADDRVAVAGLSLEGTLTEALVRAAERARTAGVPVGESMIVSQIQVVIGPNPPISQYKVILTRPVG